MRGVNVKTCESLDRKYAPSPARSIVPLQKVGQGVLVETMTTYYEEQEREGAKSDYTVFSTCYNDDLQASWHTTRTYVYKLSEQKS